MFNVVNPIPKLLITKTLSLRVRRHSLHAQQSGLAPPETTEQSRDGPNLPIRGGQASVILWPKYTTYRRAPICPRASIIFWSNMGMKIDSLDTAAESP
jgi:hypothetical protein